MARGGYAERRKYSHRYCLLRVRGVSHYWRDEAVEARERQRCAQAAQRAREQR